MFISIQFIIGNFRSIESKLFVSNENIMVKDVLGFCFAKRSNDYTKLDNFFHIDFIFDRIRFLKRNIHERIMQETKRKVFISNHHVHLC